MLNITTRTSLSPKEPDPFRSSNVDAAEELSGSETSRQVLVIDDEIPIADSLSEILKTFGFDARPFYRGQEAIEFARTHCPDVVVSDVLMPKMNGVDTVLAIRDLCPSTHILLFSGQAGTANILDSARKEGHEFELLAKPLHPEELLKRLAGFWKT